MAKEDQRIRFVGKLDPPEEVPAEVIAHFWSEWTDDEAPLNERKVYLMASHAFLEKYEVRKKI